MGMSWIKRAKQFKSRSSVVAGFVLRSREAKAAKCKQLHDENNELKRHLEKQTRKLEEQGEELARIKQQLEVLEMRHAESSGRSIVLPDDPPIGSHGHGARMVTLAVNLARSA
ncbi:MAG: hypothetical protein R6U98_17725, partial [Pirellulaceae bacterium]